MKYDWCITKTTVRAASPSFSSFLIKLYASSPMFMILWSVLLLEYSSVCDSCAVYIIMYLYLREVLWACVNSHLPQVKIVDRANNLRTVFFFFIYVYIYILPLFIILFFLSFSVYIPTRTRNDEVIQIRVHVLHSMRVYNI